jgi:hypothetical protein
MYIIWNEFDGTDATDYYICRVSRTGKVKKLATGCKFVVDNN